MIIELTVKTNWIGICLRVIQNIHKERNRKLDLLYYQYQKLNWFEKLFTKPVEKSFEYTLACLMGDKTLENARRILRLVEDVNVGDIHITNEEYDQLMGWFKIRSNGAI